MHRSLTSIASCRFDFATAVGPEQVWRALTCPELTTRYLSGLSLESEWAVGAAVVIHPPGGGGSGERLGGEVLVVEEGRRLAYTLSSGPTDPVTFVTWHIAPTEHGSNVTLYVDDTQLASAPDGEVEATWRQAVADLRTTLAGLLT